MRHAKRSVAHFARLLSEYSAQQALLRGELGLALRGDFAYQYIACGDLCADANDAAIVKIL